MALPAAVLDELRARTPLAPLVGRRVRLARSGRHHKGCCPFHGEKSPSFYVYDDHFHCFGCGAHGDAISFVMQSQGASFPEAVSQLAAEAGLELPRPEPGQMEAERRRLDLHAVLEAAQAGFRRRLAGPAGAAARDYLVRRGILPSTAESFGLGWSGPGRGDLAGELAGQDITAAMMAETGLMRLDEAGAPAGELFFNRLTFPIRDAKGRIVAFGGRVLGDGMPKYLNGPETALFSKRRTLFGHHAARSAKTQTIVLVEGYMDVIALHQAGLTGAVAPLGTALTVEQLETLWQLAKMPVLCFDGDSAGARAALRAVELALPLLSAERSLRIARLPQGDDPDSFVRQRGADAARALLDNAPTLATALFGMLSEGTGTTAEARAALRTRLEAAAASIGDRVFAREMRKALLDSFFQRPDMSRRSDRSRPSDRRAVVRIDRGPVPDAAAVHRQRWLTLAGLLLRYPQLLAAELDNFAALPMPPGLQAFGQALSAWHDGAETASASLDSTPVMTHLQRLGVAEIAAQALQTLGKPEADAVAPEQAWTHYFSLMHLGRLDEDIARATALVQGGDSKAWELLSRFSEERVLLINGESGLDAT